MSIDNNSTLPYKCCGRCKLWDKWNVFIYGDCLAVVNLPESIRMPYRASMQATEGTNCPLHTPSFVANY